MELYTNVLIVCKVKMLAFVRNVLQKEIIKGIIIFISKQIMQFVIVDINKFGIQNHFVLLIEKEVS